MINCVFPFEKKIDNDKPSYNKLYNLFYPVGKLCIYNGKREHNG
jgi:hypothetical protein